MAQVGAVHAFGESVIRHLTGAYTQERATQTTLAPARRTLPECRFEQISAARLDSDFDPGGNLVTLYLFRMAIDRNLRSTADHKTPKDPKSRPLSLELHYLLTAWGDEAVHEQTILSWAMLELHRTSLLDRSALVPAALWEPDETVQILPSEMSHENMMRIWDAVKPGYRLSASYIARTIRIETGLRESARPVIATHAALQRMEAGSDV